MSKRAQYYDWCRTRYVEEGYSVPAIYEMVNEKPDAPTRRTIQNWKADGDWEGKRSQFIAQTDDLFEISRDVAIKVGRNAQANPTAENVNSFVRLLGALKYKEAIKDINELPENEQGNQIKREEIVNMIREELTG